nr:putative ribonuclease H-like domain-containing protein [Tanacetum cinerariifolium]
MNYQPVHARNQTNSGAGFQDILDAEKAGEEVDQSYMLFPVWSSIGSINPQNNAEDAAFDGKEHDFDVKKNESKVILSPSRYRDLNAEFQDCSENNSNEVTTASSTVPTVGQNSLNSTNTFSVAEDIIYSDKEDVVGAEANFNNLKSSIPVRTKKDERGIVIRNKARLIAQGHTQEEGIDYEEVFSLVVRIEAIRLFLAYASFMGFMVYQMDVNSAFLYGTIKEEVYVFQPSGFEDPKNPDKVYKVVNALYGLHQAPRAWYETLATYLLENRFHRGTIDQTLFIKKQQKDILLVQFYVDDIIFGATNKVLCQSFEKLMKDKFHMTSMGELTFFLGLQSPVESVTGYRDLNAEFQDCSENNSNEVTTASSTVPTVGQNSLNSTNTFSVAEDIIYSDKEDVVGAEANFNNLKSSIPSNPRGYIKLKDPSWIEAMQEELLQFKMQKVCVLVDLPYGKRAIVARLEAIRLFLAYASFMGFMVYQMDVKSTFLYGTIEEEVYVCQPLGFEDPDHLEKVYKVVKALYGLRQAPRAWYETYLLKNGFQRGTIDQTLFIKKQKGDILLLQIYVDDIIFGATNKDLCRSFEKMMKDKFQMSSMGELTFFLGLQVKQKKDGIFISQDKYVTEILRKFGLTKGKSASTPIETEKPLLKDPDGEDVDVHTYRLISWQCKKQTVVATSSIEAEYVAAASCCT